jgi:hypothetical protein
VLEWSRKRGKSFFMVTVAAMLALTHKRKRIVFGAPTLKHLEEYILPLLDEVSADAPQDLRPVYEPSTGHWYFPSSDCWVHFFGADDKRKADRGRGPAAIACLFDECGFTPVLQYVLASVFRPAMLHGGLFTLLGSTPAQEPDHEFTVICETAESQGTLSHQTIFDNPRLTEAQISKFIADDARDNGQTEEEYRKSDVFQREYLALRVVDRTLVVMGEDWTAMREQSLVEVERPQFFDAYEAFDMGGVDPHAFLFGYWHFEKAWLVIEDELLLREGQNTAELVKLAQEKERALWGTSKWEGTMRALHEERADETFLLHLPAHLREKIRESEQAPLQPYLRVCDSATQVAIDMATLHGISYVPTEKVDKRWYVNEFRIACREGRVKVHPRCRNLDRHLRQTVWANHRQSDYKRKNGEHGDLLDDAVYMWRNVRKSRNPVPLGYGLDPATQFWRNRRRQENPLAAAVKFKRAK